MCSSTVGDSMQRVVLCSDRCALGEENLIHRLTLRNTSLCESEYWKAQCGERRMLRLDGGKVVRPYLSVLRVRFYEECHRELAVAQFRTLLQELAARGNKLLIRCIELIHAEKCNTMTVLNGEFHAVALL